MEQTTVLKRNEERCDFILRGNTVRVIFFLSWPVMAQMLLHSLVMAVDMKMVGFLGSNAVAAVSLSLQLMLFLFMSAWGLGVGTSATAARYFGKKDNAGLVAVVAQAAVIYIVFNALFTAAGLLGVKPLLVLLGARGEVLVFAQSYITIMLAGLFFLTAKAFFWSVFQGVGDTRSPLLLDILTNILNVAGNYVFIFGLGPIPPFGVKGAAMGTVLAHVVLSVVAVRLLLRTVFFRQPPLKELLRYHAERLKTILRIGIPVALQSVIMVGANTAIMGMLARTADGTHAISAYYLALTIYDFAFLPGIAVSTAAASLVGINIGDGNLTRANESGWRCAGLGALIIVLPAALIYLFAPVLMQFFINEAAVVRLGVLLVRTLAVVLPLHGAGMIFSRAIQGSGQTRLPFLVTVFSWLIVRVPLAWLLAFPIGLRSLGVWLAMAATQVLAAIIFFFIYRQGIILKAAIAVPAGLRALSTPQE
jgi:putative MATE family efflux protein